MRNSAAAYRSLGWGICATRHDNHKEAYVQGWQKLSAEPEHWDAHPRDGIGVVHSLSGTCSIDLDDLAHARIALAALSIDLDELLATGVQIDSGRENRGKLLYLAPEGVDKRHSVSWPNESGEGVHTVLELRAGATHDVLPPSTHPDTGLPYEWIGAPPDMQELPEQLLKLWLNWPIYKAALAAACPWAPEGRVDAPARTYSVQSSGVSVIDAFNDQVSIEQMLHDAGYKRGGTRWLSPSSSTGAPGVVVFTDGPVKRAYSHHGSCAIADGYSHDAFSIYCITQHRGDVQATVREAAGLLGIEREPDAEAHAIAASILRPVVHLKQEQAERPQDIPDPGALPSAPLRAAWEWIADQQHALKPDALTQAVLSLACALTSRRYCTHDGQPATTFFGIVDSSVAGLRTLKPLCYELAIAAGERQLLRGTRITGAGVLYQALLRHPRVYWFTDEYGHLVRGARYQQSGATESAIALIHETYTGRDIYIDPDTASQRGQARAIEDCDIYAPSVTLMALLSEDHISALGQKTEYGRGTIQQMIIVPAGDAREDHEANVGDGVPEVFVEAARKLAPPATLGDVGILAEPELIPVDWVHGAADEIRASRERMTDYMQAPTRSAWRGMAHGYAQSAIRLATMLAAWQDPRSPRIDGPTMRWACLWTERCLYLTMPLVERISGDTDEPDLIERVQDSISRIEGAFTARDVARRCRPFGRLSPERREELLSTLEDDGVISGTIEGRHKKYLASSSR